MAKSEKKDLEKIKRNKVFWNKGLKHFDLKRIREMRLELGFPEDGFFDEEEKMIWMQQNDFYNSKNSKGEFVDVSDEDLLNSKGSKALLFEDEIKEMSPYLREGFDKAINDFLYFGHVSDLKLLLCNATGCWTEYYEKGNEIEEGVYIKIGNHSSIKDIEDFIEEDKSTIREYQSIFNKRKGVEKLTRPKNENFARNRMIDTFNSYDLSKLRELDALVNPSSSNLKKDRATMAIGIMKGFGYEVEDSTFRKIAQKEKAERAKYKKGTKNTP